MGGKSIIQNGDFEDNNVYATPWTCPGNCGIGTIAQAKQPQHGNNFAYLNDQNTLGQITTAKKGDTYNLTYFAYGYSTLPSAPTALVGWGVQFGATEWTDNGTTVFTSANVQPAAWPRWTHIVNASGDGVALTFLSVNNTVFNLDDVTMVCISCPTPNHTGAIVGGVVGGLAGLGALLLGITLLWLKVLRPRRQASRGSRPSMSDAGAYSATMGTPSYGTGPRSTPGAAASSHGHGTALPSESYAGAPEVSSEPHDLRRPDVYPVFRGASTSER